MKRTKVLAMVSVLAVIVLVAIYIVITKNRPQTVTEFEDSSGWVYKCSRPIEAKDEGNTYMSGAPSPTPINQSDVAKYCTKVGIE